MGDRIGTYEQFWPFYLQEHSRALTRWVHFVGTNLAVLFLAAAVATRDWRWAPAAVICAYGFAWFSHFFIQKNRPATFTYPLWSLISDFRMWALMWVGKLGGEVARHVRAS